MTNNQEIYRLLAKDLDAKYRLYISARSIVLADLRRLLDTVFVLAKSIGEARAQLRMPFAKWCTTYCAVFDPKLAKSVCSVANRTHTRGSVQTWQLRLLGLVSTIHHSARPQAQKRRHKPTSWLSYISKTREEIRKIVERAGGVQNISDEERMAIRWQLDSLNDLKDEIWRE